jgi:hypothetical protein
MDKGENGSYGLIRIELDGDNRMLQKILVKNRMFHYIFVIHAWKEA